MSDSSTSQGAQQQSQKKKIGKGCAGCLSVFLVLYGLACIADLGGCNKSTPENAVPTKAQWRSQHPKALWMQTGRASLIGYLGQPANVQRNGENEYWRYECQDGSIQVVESVDAADGRYGSYGGERVLRCNLDQKFFSLGELSP